VCVCVCVCVWPTEKRTCRRDVNDMTWTIAENRNVAPQLLRIIVTVTVNITSSQQLGLSNVLHFRESN